MPDRYTTVQIQAKLSYVWRTQTHRYVSSFPLYLIFNGRPSQKMYLHLQLISTDPGMDLTTGNTGRLWTDAQPPCCCFQLNGCNLTFAAQHKSVG